MPENNEETAATQVEPQDAATEFEAVTSQEDLDKIIQKRLARERNKYADYDELAAKAARFDESVEANKSEVQKVTERAETAIERAEKAEQELAARTLEADRYKVIAEFGLPEDLHELVTGLDVAEMRTKAETLATYAKPESRDQRVIPTEGRVPKNRPTVNSDWLRSKFANQ